MNIKFSTPYAGKNHQKIINEYAAIFTLNNIKQWLKFKNILF